MRSKAFREDNFSLWRPIDSKTTSIDSLEREEERDRYFGDESNDIKS